MVLGHLAARVGPGLLVGQVDDVLDALLSRHLCEDDCRLHETVGNGIAEVSAVDAVESQPHIAQAGDVPINDLGTQTGQLLRASVLPTSEGADL